MGFDFLYFLVGCYKCILLFESMRLLFQLSSILVALQTDQNRCWSVCFLPKGWETNRQFLAALLHSRCSTFGLMFWNHSPQFNIFNCLDPRTNHQNHSKTKLLINNDSLVQLHPYINPKFHPSSSPAFPGIGQKSERPSPAFRCPSPSPRPWRLPWPVAPWIGWIWRDW